MKNLNTKSLNLVSRRAALIVLAACSLTFPSRVKAFEDPPGCGLNNGGNGASYRSGIDFRLTQAHVGDSVPVFPMFGVDYGACRAVNLTGSVHIATGKLVNHLNGAAIDPGMLIYAPNPPFAPGPYNILITPELVGAGVGSAKGSVEGFPKTVQAIVNVEGTVMTGGAGEPVTEGFHQATIDIVSPDIQVVQQCAYPAGQLCFAANRNVEFTGYVTNSGDITLTNVVVIDGRAGRIQLLDPTDGQPFPANVILPPGAYAVFSNSFVPTVEEIRAGSATSVIAATAQDTTEIGGPNALVTNSITSSCAICGDSNLPSPLSATLTEAQYTADHQFRFKVTGQVGTSYVIQATTNPNSKNWLSLSTNTAPFTFVDSAAALYPMRLYRAIALP